MTSQSQEGPPAAHTEAMGFEVELLDGTRAFVRPIRPDDKARLQEGLRDLSPESRYRRFHTAVATLSEQQLRYLTEIDYVDHMAWVALEADSDVGMGVARYVRLRDEPDVAEAAVTVQDRFQGRGLGTVLLEVLAASAVRNGISTFRNYVLSDNEPMLEIFDRLGGVRVHEGRGVYRVDVALPRRADVEPLDARGVLRAAAGRELVFRWVFPLTALPGPVD